MFPDRNALRRWTKRLLTPVLILLAVVVFLIERLVVDDIKALARWVGQLGVVARGEAWVAKQPPYRALVCFLLPGVLILPFKLLAVALFSQGRLLWGLAVLGAAKGAGTVVVGRIYHAAQPALLTLGWFARLRELILRWRAALYGVVEAQPWWQAAKLRVERIHHAVLSLRRGGHHFLILRMAAIRRRMFG